MDFLMRDQSPLRPQEWLAIDAAVEQTARAILVGRRFLHLVGPLGPGVQAVPDDQLTGGESATVDLLGDNDRTGIRIEARRFLPLPLLYKDFVLSWRDLELSRQLCGSLDTSGAASAAAMVAHAEDDLIVNGNTGLGLPGLRTVDGAQRLPLGDWSDPAAAFSAIVRATEALIDAGFYGASTVVAGPLLYAQLNRMFENSGLLVLQHVEKLVRGGVFETAVLPSGTALVLAAGPENMNLTLGMDVRTAYSGPESLNHVFRVLESAVLRIIQPRAVVVLEA